MSELTAAEKRKNFIDKAEKNKARFDKHLQLRKQIFGDIEPKYLETIFKSGGAIDGLFTLKMIEYAEEWHETELKNLSLCGVVQAKPEKANKDLLAIMATLIRSLSRVENNHPEILNEHDNRRLLKAKETLTEWCSIDPKDIPKPS